MHSHDPTERDATPCGMVGRGSPRRQKVVLDEKSYFFGFAKGADWKHRSYFWDFIQHFNKRYLYIKDGDLDRSRYRRDEKFSREVI
jgi:hypothetical protein